MVRWLLIALVSAAVLAALVWIVGALLPEAHVASTRAAYAQPPESLFAAITDVAAHPSWRSDVDSVEVLTEWPLRWREAGAYGTITYRAETVARPFRFVARIDDPSQPFGGRWSWRIEPGAGGGSVVSITEEGEIHSPLFRFFARFVFGYHGTQEAYLRALGERFGEETTVERVEVSEGGAPAASERMPDVSAAEPGAPATTVRTAAAEEGDMGTVTGIGGIFLKADDPTALAAWYRDRLGIPVGDETWTRFAWRLVDDPVTVGSTVWSIFDRSSDYFRSETATFMVNYRVDDLDAVLERLRAAGVQVDDRVEEYPYGRFGWATDPEGNRIELWEPVDETVPVEGAAGAAGAGGQADAGAAGSPGPGSAGDAVAEVRRAQDAMIAAELAGDADALDGLIADGFHGVDASDGPLTKASILEGYRAGTVSIDSHDVSDVDVRAFGGTAVVTGRARIRGRAGGSAFDSDLRYMDVWVRGADRWRLAAAHMVAVDAGS